MSSIFLKTEYGVIVELRLEGNRWLDRYACHWVSMVEGVWQSTAHTKILAKEIGRWTSATHDVYAAVKAAGSNDSGFRNWAS